MKNKGGELTLKEFLGAVLAIAVTFILVFFIINFAGIFTKNTRLEQAKVSMEKIYSEIEKVQGDGESKEFFLESPKDWWITAWPQEGGESPVQCETNYCICIYEKKYTDPKKTYCKDVPSEFRIKENLGHPVILISPLAPLKIYKDGDKIILEGGIDINEKP